VITFLFIVKVIFMVSFSILLVWAIVTAPWE